MGRWLYDRLTSERGDFLLAQGMFAAVTLSIVSLIGVSILQTGIELDSQTRVNGQVAKIIQTRATQVAQTGYTQVSGQAGISTVSLSLDTASTATISARQSITLDAGGQSATVLVVAGKYANGQMTDSATCSLTLSNPTTSCVYATATAVTDVSTTVPVVDNLTPVNAGDNIPASTRTKFASVTNGWSHSLALDADGRLWAWGDNSAGEIGNSTFTPVSSPTKIMPTLQFQRVAAGARTSFAIDSTGQLWAWGNADGTVGQLGTGATSAQATPAKVKAGTVFTDVQASGWSVSAVDSTGQLWSWGNWPGTGAVNGVSYPTKILSGKQIVQFARGDSQGIAIDTSGNMWAWGAGTAGILGTGNTNNQLTPIQVGTGTVWKRAAMGVTHACAIDTYQRMWCWGSNGSGEIGNGGTTSQLTPVRVGGSTFFRTLSLGYGVSSAIDTSGMLYTWGRGADSQLGTGNQSNILTPTKLTTSSRFLNVSLSNVNNTSGGQSASGANCGWTSAVDTSHYLWTWGSNCTAGLGDATTEGVRASIARVDFGATPIVQVVNNAGAASLALDSAGRLWFWGNNWNGLAGNGQAQVSTTYTPMQVASNWRWARIFGGNGTMYAVTTDGRTFGWGYNAGASNQVGVGSTASYVTTPTQLTALGQVNPTQIIGTIGSLNSDTCGALALAANGDVYAWGNNTFGCLGNGTTSPIATPTKVATGIKKMSSGSQYKNSFLLGTNNTLYSSGENYYGMLGVGDLNNRSTWSVAMSGVVDFAVGNAHVAAISTDGQAYGWGRNQNGQLGAGGSVNYVAQWTTQVNCQWAWNQGGCLDNFTVTGGVLQANGRSWNSLRGGGITTAVNQVGGGIWNMGVSNPAWSVNLVPANGEATYNYQFRSVFVDVLPVNGALCANDMLISADGGYALLMQPDGNLVLRTTAGVQWNLWRGGAGNCLVNQADGNAVIYNSSGQAVWASNTSGRGPSTFVIQNDGNIVMYPWSGGVSWNSGTNWGNRPDLGWKYPVFAQATVSVIAAQPSPRAIGSALGANAITACANTTILYNTNGGTIGGWGASTAQALNGITTAQAAPTAITSSTGATQVIGSCGGSSPGYATFLTKDGTGQARSWGAGAFGTLGRGATTDAPIGSLSIPAAVTSLTSTPPLPNTDQPVASAIDASGNVYMWGTNAHGEFANVGAAKQLSPLKIGIPVVTNLAALTGDQSTATVWRLGSLSLAGQLSNLQVNVNTAYPISGIGLWCPTTGQKMVSAAKVESSSGLWQFGNVMIADAQATGTLGTCTVDPYLSVYLEGEPLTASEVQTLIYQVHTIQ